MQALHFLLQLGDLLLEPGCFGGTRWQAKIAREARQGRGINALHEVLSVLKEEFGGDEVFLLRAVDELQQCADRHLSELHYPETIHALFETAFPDRSADFDNTPVRLDVETGIKRFAAIDADLEYVRHERRTPRTTIEALMYTVRARGATALKEPANIERLSRCDSAAKDEINHRIAHLIAAKKITP